MTEILLEVTNDEIEMIAKDVLNKSSDRGICAYSGLHYNTYRHFDKYLNELTLTESNLIIICFLFCRQIISSEKQIVLKFHLLNMFSITIKFQLLDIQAMPQVIRNRQNLVCIVAADRPTID